MKYVIILSGRAVNHGNYPTTPIHAPHAPLCHGTARYGMARQVQADRYLRDEEMRKQEELTRKQEAVRRKTLEYEAELRQQTELARVKAETEGKIRQERENHDLRLEEAREGAKEYRDTVLEGR